MADGRHIENLFWQYLSAILANLCKFSEWRWRITGRYRSLNQSGNFRKFKMAENRHFENSFISISQSELSDFEQIWYSDANFHSEDGCLTKQFDFFQIQNGGRTPYWKLFFFAISQRLIGQSTRNSKRRWRITCQYRSRDQNCNFPKFKMAEGRHFVNSFRCLRHSCNELMLSSVFQ